MTRPRTRSLSLVLTCVGILVAAGAVSAQERPPVGPEQPFQLAQRIERTLPNGLRVIVARQAIIPKVTVTLTVLSGTRTIPRISPGWRR